MVHLGHYRRSLLDLLVGLLVPAVWLAGEVPRRPVLWL